MLACTLSEHGMTAMIGATGVTWAERVAERPDRPHLCAAIAALALAHAAAQFV